MEKEDKDEEEEEKVWRGATKEKQVKEESLRCKRWITMTSRFR